MDICKRIQELFNKERLYVTDIWELIADEQTGVVSVQIDNGDWKHEHARARYLLQHEFGAVWIVSETFDNDNMDDCYSAVHYFYIPKKYR